MKNTTLVRLPHTSRKDELEMRTWIRLNTSNPKWKLRFETISRYGLYHTVGVYLNKEDALMVTLKYGC